MRGKKLRKIVSVLLCCVMLFNMRPSATLAAGIIPPGENGTQTEEQNDANLNENIAISGGDGIFFESNLSVSSGDAANKTQASDANGKADKTEIMPAAALTSEAGVYGWKILDKNGNFVGGVKYPGSAGYPNAMDLSGFFSETGWIGDWDYDWWGNGIRYEEATVSLGSIAMTLDTEEDYAEFVKEIQENYTLEVLMIDVNSGEFVNEMYPYAWVKYQIEEVKHTDYQGQTHTFTIKLDTELSWDYCERSATFPVDPRFPATFAVTITEPERMTTDLVTGWGITENGTDYVGGVVGHINGDADSLIGLSEKELVWPNAYKIAIDGEVTEADLAGFLQKLKDNYQIRIRYRNYWTGNGEGNPLYLNIPIKNVTIESQEITDGSGYVVLKVTPAVNHQLHWHWGETFEVSPGPELNYRIYLKISAPVSQTTADAHKVTTHIVDPEKTTVNFFDYWLTDREANDFEAFAVGTESDVVKLGINSGHLFNFIGSFAFPGAQGNNNVSNLGRWNVWTGDTLYAPWPDGNVALNGGYGNGATFNNSPDGILKPHRGIVAQTLTDGYPTLAFGPAAWITEGNYNNTFPDMMGGEFVNFYDEATRAKYNESLAYLFDPENTENSDYKKAVADVKGLFQMDNEGYYYYDSQKNFAELNEAAKQITLYDEPWKVAASVDVDNATTDAKGQFFPFNDWSTLFSEDPTVENGVTQDHYSFRGQNSATDYPMNHYFGMTVETEFQQPIDGYINQGKNRIPMTFTFSGDDDVWIFIDDVLVGDLGGLHNPVSISINFATGEIVYTAIDAPGGETVFRKDKLKDMFDNASKTRGIDQAWNGDTFANGSIHTLKFFYLERGNDVSNCSLRFNTLPAAKDSIRKVDENGAVLGGALFDLYHANKNGEEYEEDELVATKLSLENDPDNKDLYTIMDEDGNAIDFTDYLVNTSQSAWFILRETTVPAGYRTNPDVILEFHPQTYTFTVVNKYETGAYASFTAVWQQIVDASYASYNTDGTLSQGDMIADIDLKEGLTLVVPVIKYGSRWLPMYGSNTKGWNTIKSPTADDFEKDLALAAFLQLVGEEYQDWYMRWVEGADRLTGSMSYLPGDATRYVYNNPSGDLNLLTLYLSKDVLGQLNVSVEADASDEERLEALREQLEGITDEAGARTFLSQLSNDNFKLLYSDDFNRTYRTVIYMPNEQRELRVRKVDENGEFVNGAVFAIFSTSEAAKNFDKKYTSTEDALKDLANGGYDGLESFGATGTVTLETSDGTQDGLIVFRETASPEVRNGYAKITWPSGRDEGATGDDNDNIYWMKEIYAPESYNVNQNLVRIEVGDLAIYANATGYDSDGKMLAAGTNDGIQVQAALGKLSQILAKYAIGNNVDVTLQDITINKQVVTNVGQNGALPREGGNWQDVATGKDASYNLHYGMNSEDLTGQYGLHDANDIIPAFTVDDGYVRVMPRQTDINVLKAQYNDKDHDFATKRTELGDQQLDALFGLMNIVIITDPVGEPVLEISKVVEGNAPAGDVYEFEITLTAPAGVTLEKEYHAYIHATDHQVEVLNADGTKTLRPCTPVDHANPKGNGENCTDLILNDSGKMKITLKAGQTYVITGLPAGTKYEIKEIIKTAGTEYETAIRITGEEKAVATVNEAGLTASGLLNTKEIDGVIPAIYVVYTNRVKVPVVPEPAPEPVVPAPTGDLNNLGLWVSMAVLSLLMLASVILLNKRKCRYLK